MRPAPFFVFGGLRGRVREGMCAKYAAGVIDAQSVSVWSFQLSGVPEN